MLLTAQMCYRMSLRQQSHIEIRLDFVMLVADTLIISTSTRHMHLVCNLHVLREGFFRSVFIVLAPSQQLQIGAELM